ncbi:unnamed protein product [Urochloa decumbens]|uniref:Disease resistance protein At4g27190-like leucine-rich repeats domain-containing protein n=1 Tax=Urochloa decumbens TaxID=240449 RepID=A0ABC9B396_9POAL
MFYKQDEKDDFNGVDPGKRDVIRSVSEVIGQTLGYRKCMMIFLNGSDDEVDPSRFGFSPNSSDHVIVWTFKRQFLTIHDRGEEIKSKLRYTHFFLDTDKVVSKLENSLFCALLREEAANIVARHTCMGGIDPTMVTDCCLYEFFLYYSFHRTTGFDWVAHASNYWVCDGIVKADVTREISNTLHQEIRWECDASLLDSMFEEFIEDSQPPFLVVNNGVINKERSSWISITSKNLTVLEDMKAVLERASSLFVALERSNNNLQGLASGFLKHCGNLGVLVLYCCAFSFVSPPFLQCHGLRFLGLDHCTHDNTSEVQKRTTWTCLCSLLVLDVRYTDWDEILSEEKMDLMDNLRELNIEGVCCWQYTYRLQGRLPNLRRLRIIKPAHQAKTSIDSDNSIMGKTDLEILDLSGNGDMENIPRSLSMARSLQALILDGCHGLEDVVVPDCLPSSLLRSFSFDGYGPAAHWTSSVELPPESSRLKFVCNGKNKKVKTSKISLQGCMQLENLFVRGLSNLVELDLSGSAIKVLCLKTMVVDVPGLKRIYLLGCEHLRAIKWGSFGSKKQLELLCVDTHRGPGREHRLAQPSLGHHKSFRLQLHAVLADSRLARSLYFLVKAYENENIYFDIKVTSSTKYGVQLKAAGGKEMILPCNRQRHMLVDQYGDVFSKIGNDAPMLVFPQPPAQQLDRHIEISDGSRGLDSELARHFSLPYLMRACAESLHVHDASTRASMAEGDWYRLRWCRMERCSNLVAVFPPRTSDDQGSGIRQLQTIWVSDLQMARRIWSKGVWTRPSFKHLQHLHLRSCPRLQFVLPVSSRSFPSLQTLHILHCSDLRHVLELDEEEIAIHEVQFPKLATVHLHDLPKLRQICEAKMLAPALKSLRIRGCFGLRRLPAVAACEPGHKRPTVEMEKDVWGALQWDGLAAGHHPDLFEPPVHSRHHRRRLLRGTVLRYVPNYSYIEKKERIHPSLLVLTAYSLICTTRPLAFLAFA